MILNIFSRLNVTCEVCEAVREMSETKEQLLKLPVSHGALCSSVVPATAPPVTRAAVELWDVATTNAPPSVTKVTHVYTNEDLIMSFTARKRPERPGERPHYRPRRKLSPDSYRSCSQEVISPTLAEKSHHITLRRISCDWLRESQLVEGRRSNTGKILTRNTS